LPQQQSHDLKKAAWKLSESLARFSRRLRSSTPLAPSDAPAHPSALKMLQLFDVRWLHSRRLFSQSFFCFLLAIPSLKKIFLKLVTFFENYGFF